MPIKNPNQKLNDSKDMPKVETLTDPKAIARYGGSRMLLAPPIAYDALMKSIPYGKLITTDRLRDHLAKRHSADFTCPLTCGIFVNVVAHASTERGGVDETPWWRTLKKDGELGEKYPEGIDGQRLRLEIEGHTVIQKGKRWFVKDYEQKLFDLAEDTSVPIVMTIEMTDSNDIHFPFEWCMQLELGTGYVQITLVDDRIVIHKPTVIGAVYTKPCKVGDNSYIRSMGLFGVRVPKQLFEALNIGIGDKIDLTLEENCLSIRKRPDDVLELSEPEPSIPIMAFCCVCGNLLYTESGLVKISAKFICHECIEAVKEL